MPIRKSLEEMQLKIQKLRLLVKEMKPRVMRQQKMQMQRPGGKGPTAGLLFVADSETVDEALARGGFGTGEDELDPVLDFVPEMPCFMYKLADETLHGVFRARCSGGYNLLPDYQPDPKLRGVSRTPVMYYRWWNCINPLQGRHVQHVLGMVLAKAAGASNPTKQHAHALALTQSQVDALLDAFSKVNPGVESRHLLGSNPIARHNGPSPTYRTSDVFTAAGPGPGGPHIPGALSLRDDAFGGVPPPNSCRASSSTGQWAHRAMEAYNLKHARRLDQATPGALILRPGLAMPPRPPMLPDSRISYGPMAVNAAGGFDYGRLLPATAPWQIPGETTGVPRPRHVVTLDPHPTLQGGQPVRSMLCHATDAHNQDCLDGEADSSTEQPDPTGHDADGFSTVQVANIPGSVRAGTAPTLADVFAYLDLGKLGDTVDLVYLYDDTSAEQPPGARARLTLHARLPEDALKLLGHLRHWRVAGRKPGSVTLRGGVSLLGLQKRALVLKGPPSSYDFSSYDFRLSGIAPVPFEFFAGPARCVEFSLLTAAGISPKSRVRPPAPAPAASTALQMTRKRKADVAALPPSVKPPAKGGERGAVAIQAPIPSVATPPSQETLGAGPSKKPRRPLIVWTAPDELNPQTPLKVRVTVAGKPGTGAEPGSTGGKATVFKGQLSSAMDVHSAEAAGQNPNAEGTPPTPPRNAAPAPQGNRKRAATPASAPDGKRRKTPALSGEALDVGSAAPPIPSGPSEGGGPSQEPGRKIVWTCQEDRVTGLRIRVINAVADQEAAAKVHGQVPTSLGMRAAGETPRVLKAQEELKPPEAQKLESVSPRLDAHQDEEKSPPTPDLQKLECVRPPLSAHQEEEGKKSSVDVSASVAEPRANGRAAASEAPPSTDGHSATSNGPPSANGHAGALPAIEGAPGTLPVTNGAAGDGAAADPVTGLRLEGETPPQVAEGKVLALSEAADAGEGFPDSEEAPECEFGGDFIALE